MSDETRCQTCGMRTQSLGEFHPYAFCVLYKGALDPWHEIRVISAQLAGAGLDASNLPDHPPRVADVIPR